MKSEAKSKWRQKNQHKSDAKHPTVISVNSHRSRTRKAYKSFKDTSKCWGGFSHSSPKTLFLVNHLSFFSPYFSLTERQS